MNCYKQKSYLVPMEPEDERGLLVSVVDLARQVEHAADVDKHLAVAQDFGRWHCKGKKVVNGVIRSITFESHKTVRI